MAVKRAAIKRATSDPFWVMPERAFARNFGGQLPPRLFHYTSQDALSSILHSSSIWATDVHYLNDSEEYLFAIDCAKEAIQRVSRSTTVPGGKELAASIAGLLSAGYKKEYYIFSLSEDGDSLNQWRSYTRRGPGYALSFDSGEFMGLCMRHAGLFGKCIYDRSKVEQAIELLASSYVNDLVQYFPLFGPGEINEGLIFSRALRFMDFFLSYAAFVKHPAFHQEAEWRVVFSSDSATPSEVEHRCGPHSLVPHLVLKWEPAAFLRALRGVILKPTAHIELSHKAIQSLIRSLYAKANLPEYDASQFEILRSKVPYREGAGNGSV
jgi:hypothetical protein